MSARLFFETIFDHQIIESGKVDHVAGKEDRPFTAAVAAIWLSFKGGVESWVPGAARISACRSGKIPNHSTWLLNHSSYNVYTIAFTEWRLS
jgi:hypothetical protein